MTVGDAIALVFTFMPFANSKQDNVDVKNVVLFLCCFFFSLNKRDGLTCQSRFHWIRFKKKKNGVGFIKEIEPRNITFHVEKSSKFLYVLKPNKIIYYYYFRESVRIWSALCISEPWGSPGCCGTVKTHACRPWWNPEAHGSMGCCLPPCRYLEFILPIISIRT